MLDQKVNLQGLCTCVQLFVYSAFWFSSSLPEAKRALSMQVQRLVAILSVPGVSRRKLLEGSSLDPGPDLTQQERKQLEAAGWKPGATIRSLLNFTGHYPIRRWFSTAASAI